MSLCLKSQQWFLWEYDKFDIKCICKVEVTGNFGKIFMGHSIKIRNQNVSIGAKEKNVASNRTELKNEPICPTYLLSMA